MPARSGPLIWVLDRAGAIWCESLPPFRGITLVETLNGKRAFPNFDWIALNVPHAATAGSKGAGRPIPTSLPASAADPQCPEKN